jgi:hypothetical protein
MSDEEFAARLEIRLRKYFRIDMYVSEKIFEIVADLRGMEREINSRELELEEQTQK